MQSFKATGEHVRAIIERFLTTPDEALFTADVFVADWKVRLRSTCSKTTALYAQRLRSSKPIAPDNAAGLTFTLLETNELAWAKSYPDWRGPPGLFERLMRNLGFEGICPESVEPCTIFDAPRHTGAQVVASVGDLPPWHTGAPFRILLHMAAVKRGWGFIHAATLADGDGGVLIVGPGKAGKSGTTLAGISAGLKTAGDDYVLVCPGTRPTAFRVYNVLKQDRRGLARIRGLAEATAHMETNWQNKLEFDPEELFPGCVVERVYLRAIVAPKIAHAPKTQFLPVDPQRVFQQFWPSHWTQLPVEQAWGFRFAASLMRSLPTFDMPLSDDPAEIGDSIGNFIAGLRT